jgi:mersacidin/lichenicidin family type 2 lantibiotic
MSHEDIDIVRAWKDEEYRNSLSEEQRAQLPENPAGTDELSDETMESVAAGILGSIICGANNTDNNAPIVGCVPSVGLTCGTLGNLKC